MVYWNLSYFKQLYDQYTASGTSIRGFCQSQGIKENRFYYWIHKLKLHVAPVAKSSQSFIPITPQGVGCLTGVAIQTQGHREFSKHQQDIKLTYPNGVVLQFEAGCDIEMLKQLITLIP